MSTRKVTTVTEEAAPEDDATTLLFTEDDDATAEVDALEGMISEFSGSADAVVNVYRQGDGKSLSFLFRTHPGEMTGGEIMEQCRDAYGTGDYRVHIRSGPRLVANKPFSVEARKVDENTPTNSGGLDVTMMLTMMQENNNRTMQMFSETMKAIAGSNNNQPTFDPVAAQASLMQQLVSLKGLAEPKDESKGAIEMFVQGITLARDLAPKEGETNSSDLLLKGLEMFAPTIAEATKQGLNRQNTDPQKPGFVGEQIAPPNQPLDADAQREHEMGLMKIAMQHQLAFLIKQAEGGKDPELYAELLLDQVGVERALSFVGQPDAMQKLVAINPAVQLHHVWFDRLKAAIIELTTDEDAGEDTGNDAVPVVGEVITKAESDALPESTDAGNTGGNSERSTGDSGDT